MNGMRAGSLRNRVTIQSPNDTSQDAATGQVKRTWDTVATVSAAIHPLSAKELILRDQVQSEITHRVVLRYRAGITSAMRVVFGSRTFEIAAVRNVEERNVMLELLCVETT